MCCVCICHHRCCPRPTPSLPTPLAFLYIHPLKLNLFPAPNSTFSTFMLRFPAPHPARR